MQISLAELQGAFARLPANKALPSQSAPAILWKTAADTMACKALPAINQWLAAGETPTRTDLHEAEICLIPTPCKPLVGPDALRPISLLPPQAKAPAMILNDKIRPQVLNTVGQLPQYAYFEGRCLQDALDRALHHCKQTRDIVFAQRQTIHLRRQGHGPDACRGGLTQSFDLKKAFDLLPRKHLLDSLEAASVDSEVVWAIMRIHDSVRMSFQHGDHQASIGTSNGVWQGCNLARSHPQAHAKDLHAVYHGLR